MTAKLKGVPYAVRCRCGVMLPKGATARWDGRERLYYDCHMCRPRPDARDEASERTGIFRLHNCWQCDHGRLPCRQGNHLDCDNPRARND